MADLRRRPGVGFRVTRRFKTGDDWEKWSSYDWRGQGFGNEPSLGTVLENRAVVVLGGPGAGKSTVAEAAVDAAIERCWVPIHVKLRSYPGDLAALVARSAPDDVIRDLAGDAALTPIYVLDGLDEVPAEHFERFVQELAALHRDRPSARVLLTSRQAFYASHRQQLREPYAAYHLLDLRDEDIDAFIEHAGVDRAVFRRAADGAHLSYELHNPFALETLLALFAARRHLGSTRSDAVDHVIRTTLETRPTSDRKRELQALRMLALAMEIAARNELTADQARHVLQAAFRFESGDAQRLLDELSLSVLIQTAGGYAFLMRSYGEYLAAEELADTRELERLLEPMMRGDTRAPHDSWRNAACYLVEKSAGARSYFVKHHPDWLLGASPSAFEDVQRDRIARSVIAGLKARQEYLHHHPVILASNLGRFLSQEVVRELVAAARSADDVEASNAVLLLGASGHRAAAPEALGLALDGSRSGHVRYSALQALDRIGAPEMIPDLLAARDDDPTLTSRIDTASALMDSAHAGAVMEGLARTSTIISSAFHRFGELSAPEEIEAVIDAALAVRADKLNARIGMYLERMWPRMVRVWREAWAPKVATLVLLSENDSGDSAADKLAAALLNLPDRGASVGRIVVERLAREGRALRGFDRAVASLIDVADVRRVVEDGQGGEMLHYLRAFGSREVRDYLFSLPGPAPTPAHDGEVEKFRKRREEAARRRDEMRSRAAQSTDGDEILRSILQLQQDHWPELPAEQRDALAQRTSSLLSELDLPTRITWEAEGSFSMPSVLPGLLRAIDRYELKLGDDRPLVQALRANEAGVIEKYHRRHGLSQQAIEDVEAMALDDDLPDGAQEGVLEFIAQAKMDSASVRTTLSTIAVGARPSRNRMTSLRAMAEIGDVHSIAAAAKILTGELRAKAESLLLAAQHRPTIERKLSELIDAPALLTTANTDEHFIHPIGWIRQVKLPDAWEKLKEIRRVSLRGSLQHVVPMVTEAMAGIDQLRLSRVILEQIDDAPADWRAYQRLNAAEHARDATIRAAQAAPFDRVIHRLKAFSTMTRFKLCIEGPNDTPAAESLTGRLPGVPGNIVVRSVGGWNQVLNPNWQPTELSDGCSDLLVVLDGDRARDWSRKPDHPVLPAPDISAALSKFEANKIEVHVLERYALENYFPQSAFEQVLGKSLAGRFPMDPARSVRDQIPEYRKSLNGALAEATSLDDLKGTDLGRILEEVAARARE